MVILIGRHFGMPWIAVIAAAGEGLNLLGFNQWVYWLNEEVGEVIVKD